MTEEYNPPEICKKYDVLSNEIDEIKSCIETLQNDNKGYEEQLKEAIEIVSEAEKIGEKSEHFRMKIQELDKKLLENDASIKVKFENIFIYNKELEDILGQIKEINYVKIYISSWIRTLGVGDQWVQNETWEKYKNNMFVSRLV